MRSGTLQWAERDLLNMPAGNRLAQRHTLHPPSHKCPHKHLRRHEVRSTQQQTAPPQHLDHTPHLRPLSDGLLLSTSPHAMRHARISSLRPSPQKASPPHPVTQTASPKHLVTPPFSGLLLLDQKKPRPAPQRHVLGMHLCGILENTPRRRLSDTPTLRTPPRHAVGMHPRHALGRPRPQRHAVRPRPEDAWVTSQKHSLESAEPGPDSQQSYLGALQWLIVHTIHIKP